MPDRDTRHETCGVFTLSLDTNSCEMLCGGWGWWCGLVVAWLTTQPSRLHSGIVLLGMLLLKTKTKTKMLLPREPSQQTQIFSILAGALYPPAGG